MLGWTEITTDPETEQYLHDPFMTDEDSASLLELGANADGAIRRSYSLLDADLVILDALPPFDLYGHTGRLLFA